MKQKVNAASNFIRRVKTFATNIDELTTTHQIIFSQLKLNNYPPRVTARLIDRSKERPIAITIDDVITSEGKVYPQTVCGSVNNGTREAVD